MSSIKELKRRYRENLALGRALPTYDLGIPLPLSTGNPLFDAALTEKLSRTTTLDAPEHLARAWHLVQQATPEERATLTAHARALLNDWKLLLALRAWQLDDGAQVRALLATLPWGWRLAFPSSVVKPSSQLFTGWKKKVPFRLVEDPRWDALRALYRELLAAAPGTALLKYRSEIQQSMALLHYKPDGEREVALHSLAFERGVTAGAPEPIATYLAARDAVKANGARGLLDALAGKPDLPITSFMGLVGSSGIRLKDDAAEHVQELRDYAIKCATPIECLLRLKEWSDWLTDAHVAQVAARVTGASFDIPFAKVIKAYLAAPHALRVRVREPLLVPMLRKFGLQMARLLPAPGPVTFVMPVNVVHLMSFLLYAVIAAVAPARLVLVKKKGVVEAKSLTLDDVIPHLADDRVQLEAWLLAQFGGTATTYDFTYDMPALAKVLDGIDPAAPVVLDMPFADSLEILTALLPRERVFNLNTAFGAPGEICVAYEYYQHFAIETPEWSYRSWSRYSDSAANRFAELLERLDHFDRLSRA